MKEDYESASRRDSKSSSTYISCVNTQDYFVTTKKLRDRVLTARSKCQNANRKTIRNMRSAPPFQNRNLDNYPMPYNRDDAVRSARGHRTDKRDTNDRMQKARADSGLMKEYSKQMFDFSVKTVNDTKVYGKSKNRGPSKNNLDDDKLISSGTNGPTPDGSILHNRKQKVLNSIRIRPHAEHEGKFHHERSRSRLSLQHTISDKNRRYRVRSVTETTRPMSMIGNASVTSNDFIFEPLVQNGELNELHSLDMNMFHPRRHTIHDLQEYNETDSIEGVFGKDPFDDIDDCNSYVSSDFGQVQCKVRPSVTSLLPPDISCNIRLVSLNESSSSESEEEKEEPVVEVKKPEPPPPKPPSKPLSRGKKNSKITFIVEEEKKAPEPEPEPEPVKVKLVLKGPHCWVDDATITSESEDEKGDVTDGNVITEDQPAQPDAVTEKLNNNQKTNNASKTKTLMKNAVANNTKPQPSTILKQPNQQAMKDAFQKALENVQSKPNETIDNNVNNRENVVKKETDDKKADEPSKEVEQVIRLPPFLCPSSERKSREAALKDWLAHTCFRNGNTAVPIV